MKRNKSSISNVTSYPELGAFGMCDFWDQHELRDCEGYGHEAQFEVVIQSETVLYAVEKELSRELCQIAEQHGISPNTLLNLWIQEKVMQLTNQRKQALVKA